MSNAWGIEIGEAIAGLVVGDAADFRFFSSTTRFDRLDSTSFPSLRDAHPAISRHLQERRHGPHAA